MSPRARRFDQHYREQIRLDDARPVELRLLRAEDAPLLVEGFTHLSSQSRYLRFHSGKEQLSEREVAYFTHVDNEQHLAIVALERTDSGHERGLGVARFVRLASDPESADVAVTVIDEVQHHGLGTALCQRLMEAARERGVRRLHFEILTSNQPMIALMHELAPTVHEHVETGILSADIELAPPE